MTNFQVRVNGVFNDVKAAVDTIRFQMGCAESIVYQHEDGNRPHCHIYMFACMFKIDKLRRVCTQYFTGNADYSCKAKAGKGKDITIDGAVRYGSRQGQLHYVDITGYDPGKITSMENEFRKKKIAIPLPYYQQLMINFSDANPTIHDQLANVMLQPDATVYSQWDFIKIKAKRFAFETNGYVWSPKAGTDYKAIVMTFCMRNGIAQNPQDKIVN